MAPDRYYAEHAPIADVFRSRFLTGWQIFDRLQGNAPVAIAFARNRREANKIRDALNAFEEKTP